MENKSLFFTKKGKHKFLIIRWRGYWGGKRGWEMHIIDTICLKQFCLKIEKICLEIQNIFLKIQNICLKSKMRAREHSSECLIYVKSKKLLIETKYLTCFSIRRESFSISSFPIRWESLMKSPSWDTTPITSGIFQTQAKLSIPMKLIAESFVIGDPYNCLITDQWCSTSGGECGQVPLVRFPNPLSQSQLGTLSRLVL